MKKLTIVVPVFNEKNNILPLMEKIEAVNLEGIEKEIIIIDDFSTDGTREIIKHLERKYRVIYQDKNYGKGFALRVGFKFATGDYVIIQDADLEYDPEDYKVMIAAIVNKKVNVVYGSRRLNKKNIKYSGISFYLGGILVTAVTNLLYGTRLTDEPTCYKLFKKDILDSISLECVGFEFCPEITAKVAKKGEKIAEVPIRYYPRHVQEGKKLNWKDGIKAIKTLLKFRFKKKESYFNLYK